MSYLSSASRDDEQQLLQRMLEPSPDELAALTMAIAQLRRAVAHDRHGGAPLRFQLASTLVTHTRASYVEEGVRMLEKLTAEHYERQAQLRYRMTRCSSSGSGGVAADDSDDRDSFARDDSDDSDRVPTTSHRIASSLRQRTPATTTNSSHAVGVVQRGTVVTRATAPPPSDDDYSYYSRHGHATTTTATTSNGNGNGERHDDFIARGDLHDVTVYYYYLAVGYVKLQMLDKAHSCVERTLAESPQHRQACMLKSYIERQQKSELVTQTATVAGVALVGGLLLGLLCIRKNKK